MRARHTHARAEPDFVDRARAHENEMMQFACVIRFFLAPELRIRTDHVSVGEDSLGYIAMGGVSLMN